jgi:hypothetical protein
MIKNCIDCGKKISKDSIRCFSCANSGKRNPSYKGGKPKCIICGKQLSSYGAKYCKFCLMKYHHPAKGYKHTEESKQKLSNERIDNNNPNWKGDVVGYSGLHGYIKRKLKKPKICSNCNKIKKLDIANISGEYKRDLNDWKWLCRRCHMVSDGRLEKLKSYIKHK